MNICPRKWGMKSEAPKTNGDGDFRRVTGVKRGTFGKMTETLVVANAEKRKHRGRNEHAP